MIHIAAVTDVKFTVPDGKCARSHPCRRLTRWPNGLCSLRGREWNIYFCVIRIWNITKKNGIQKLKLQNIVCTPVLVDISSSHWLPRQTPFSMDIHATHLSWKMIRVLTTCHRILYQACILRRNLHMASFHCHPLWYQFCTSMYLSSHENWEVYCTPRKLTCPWNFRLKWFLFGLPDTTGVWSFWSAAYRVLAELVDVTTVRLSSVLPICSHKCYVLVLDG